MKTIDIWTYRIQNNTGSITAFELGLEAGKHGFFYLYKTNDEHYFLTKEELPFNIQDNLKEFEIDGNMVECRSSDICLVNEDDEYEFNTLYELIDEVFYEDDAEIVLPKYNVVLKITNQNFY